MARRWRGRRRRAAAGQTADGRGTRQQRPVGRTCELTGGGVEFGGMGQSIGRGVGSRIGLGGCVMRNFGPCGGSWAGSGEVELG